MDNCSAIKRPADHSKEPSLYVKKVEIGVMFKEEHDRATTAPKTLNQKPPYLNKVAEKKLLAKYAKISKVRWSQRNTEEHVSRFLDSMGKYTKDPELCLREFTKSLTDRAYT